MTQPEIISADSLVLATPKHRFPPQHFIIYGRSGVGKSRLLTTFPKPILVFMFDAFGKDTQYLRFGGTSYSEIVDVDISAKQDGSCPIPTRYVFNAKGEVVMQIHYLHDDDWHAGTMRIYAGGENPGFKEAKDVAIPRPVAYPRFLAMMAELGREESRKWGTIALDSVTSCAKAARLFSEFTMNPWAKEPRQHFGFATDRLEQMLTGRWLGFQSNVVLIAHVNRQRDEKGNDKSREEIDSEMIHKLSAPGRLATADGLPSQYSEFYRMYSTPKTHERWLQTENDGRYNASTSIDAPDGSPPDYLALWANWKK